MSVIINFDTMRTPDIIVADSEWTRSSDKREKHAAEPIKKIEDIARIRNYLIAQRRYRDNLLFVIGITSGLRCGDLLQLTFGHFVDRYGNFKPEIVVQEEKTNKYRTFYMTKGMGDALKAYVADRPVNLDDYLFPSESCNDSAAYYETISLKTRATAESSQDETYRIRAGVNGPISVRSVNRILKELINEQLHIDIHASTHTLRKTFAYQTIMTSPDRDRAIEFLQQLLGHSSQRITLRYAGITDDEIREHYQNLDAAYSAGFDFVGSSGLCYARKIS